MEPDANPLNNFRQVSSKTCTISSAYDPEFVELAPGYKAKINVPLSPVKYYNQRLLNYKQIFTSVNGYICFAQFILQQLMLRSQISIETQKFSACLVI